MIVIVITHTLNTRPNGREYRNRLSTVLPIYFLVVGIDVIRIVSFVQ